MIADWEQQDDVNADARAYSYEIVVKSDVPQQCNQVYRYGVCVYDVRRTTQPNVTGPVYEAVYCGGLLISAVMLTGGTSKYGLPPSEDVERCL